MRASRLSRLRLALFVVPALSGTAQARNDSQAFALTDRIACQDAIERVYARHRTGGRDDDDASAVPTDVGPRPRTAC
jgi:hypothetical protein